MSGEGREQRAYLRDIRTGKGPLKLVLLCLEQVEDLYSCKQKNGPKGQSEEANAQRTKEHSRKVEQSPLPDEEGEAFG